MLAEKIGTKNVTEPGGGTSTLTIYRIRKVYQGRVVVNEELLLHDTFSRASRTSRWNVKNAGASGKPPPEFDKEVILFLRKSDPRRDVNAGLLKGAASTRLNFVRQGLRLLRDGNVFEFSPSDDGSVLHPFAAEVIDKATVKSRPKTLEDLEKAIRRSILRKERLGMRRDPSIASNLVARMYRVLSKGADVEGALEFYRRLPTRYPPLPPAATRLAVGDKSLQLRHRAAAIRSMNYCHSRNVDSIGLLFEFLDHEEQPLREAARSKLDELHVSFLKIRGSPRDEIAALWRRVLEKLAAAKKSGDESGSGDE